LRLVKVDSADAGKVPAFKHGWRPYDVDWVWFCWDAVLSGASIDKSVWLVPSGWTVLEQETSVAVQSFETGAEYAVANAALVSVSEVVGAYRIANRVELSDGRKYERSVGVSIVDAWQGGPL